MPPWYTDDAVTVWHGDCLDVLADMADNSVDAVVTDPPYLLSFMGRQWDSLPAHRHLAWHGAWAAECYRVMKPGAHLLAFGGTRTHHRLACAIEDAGFEIRDSMVWLYGSGFPKSLDVSKAIDRAAGAEREVIGTRPRFPDGGRGARPGVKAAFGGGEVVEFGAEVPVTAPATDDARRWNGWGTALKPAHEPIVVARKPLAGTVAANVLTWGTGALNIDATRIGPDVDTRRSKGSNPSAASAFPHSDDAWVPHVAEAGSETGGRWPPNVALDPDTAAALDQQSGILTSNARINKGTGMGYHGGQGGPRNWELDDSGGASRFFPVFRYEPKAPTLERPRAWRPSCDCETIKPWQEALQPRATDDSNSDDDRSWNTSTSGNSDTDPYHQGTTSTTETETNSTTPSTTSSSSPSSSTNASTPAVNSGTVSGGSPVASAESSSPSTPTTGISAPRAGPFMDDAGPATSPEWSATSVCGSCGAPARPDAHPTTKPLDLIRWLVRLVTPSGGVVLDPFLGSGTTAEACIVEGFRCIGVEREPSYLPMIRARLTKPIQPVLDLGEL